MEVKVPANNIALQTMKESEAIRVKSIIHYSTPTAARVSSFFSQKLPLQSCSLSLVASLAPTTHAVVQLESRS